MNLGELIDDLYVKRAARLEAQKKTDEAKGIEDIAKLALIGKLQEMGLEKASGGLATAGIKTIVIPRVKDWDAMYLWIAQNHRFDMLHKRVSELAWRDAFLEGDLIPGTEAVDDVKLSLTKSSR